MATLAEATTTPTSPAAEATEVEPAQAEQPAQAETAPDDAEAVAAETEVAPRFEPVRFTGTQRNMVAGIGMLIASIMAFTMGMTDVFFAEATAWIFAIWGALLIYAGMLDLFRVFEVTEDALRIQDDLRPWDRLKVWDWQRLNRLDIVVKKPSAQPKDVEMYIYYNPEGELVIEREDRIYDAQLAQLIIERAGLNPAEQTNPTDLTQIPVAEKQTFTWSK